MPGLERHLAHPEVAPLLARVDPQGIVLLADSLFAQLTTVVNGIDLMALIETPEGHLPHRIEHDCVILDGIQDAGNVGSILRCAATAGVRDVFMTTGCAFAWSAKTLRAAMGAHFHLNVVEHCTFESVHARLHVPLLATSSHARHAVFDMPLNTPVGWVFGNEGRAFRSSGCRWPRPSRFPSRAAWNHSTWLPPRPFACSRPCGSAA